MQKIITLLCRSLEAAPFPVECKIDSIDPEDTQKWSDRYNIWYKEIRSYVLSHLSVDAKNHLYYQIDQLVQEAHAIQSELHGLDITEQIVEYSSEKTQTQEEQVIEENRPTTSSIVIGQVKKKT